MGCRVRAAAKAASDSGQIMAKWVKKEFTEATERIATAAKTEIEGMLTGAIHRIGMKTVAEDPGVFVRELRTVSLPEATGEDENPFPED